MKTDENEVVGYRRTIYCGFNIAILVRLTLSVNTEKFGVHTALFKKKIIMTPIAKPFASNLPTVFSPFADRERGRLKTLAIP